MKKEAILFFLGVFVFAGITFGEPPKPKRTPITPKECRTAKFTCVIKIADGVPYFCQKTVKQRYRNAKKEFRVVTARKCRNKFPVYYKQDKQVAKE